MPIVNGTTYHDDTHPLVIELLELLQQNRNRVRIFYGDQFYPFRDWGDLPMRGRIGRSMGSGDNSIPLLIRTNRSMGGEGILTHVIIRIEPSPADGSAYFDIRQNPPPYRGIGPWAPREALERGEMNPTEAAVWSDYVAERGTENLALDYEEVQRLLLELDSK